MAMLDSQGIALCISADYDMLNSTLAEAASGPVGTALMHPADAHPELKQASCKI